MQPPILGALYGLLFGLSTGALVLRSQALVVMAKPFMEAARTAGGSGWWLVRVHLLPHLLPMTAVQMMAAVTGAVITFGFLEFTGAGGNWFGYGSLIYSGLPSPGLVPRDYAWNALLAGGLGDHHALRCLLPDQRRTTRSSRSRAAGRTSALRDRLEMAEVAFRLLSTDLLSRPSRDRAMERGVEDDHVVASQRVKLRTVNPSRQPGRIRPGKSTVHSPSKEREVLFEDGELGLQPVPGSDFGGSVGGDTGQPDALAVPAVEKQLELYASSRSKLFSPASRSTSTPSMSPCTTSLATEPWITIPSSSCAGEHGGRQAHDPEGDSDSGRSQHQQSTPLWVRDPSSHRRPIHGNGS